MNQVSLGPRTDGSDILLNSEELTRKSTIPYYNELLERDDITERARTNIAKLIKACK